MSQFIDVDDPIHTYITGWLDGSCFGEDFQQLCEGQADYDRGWAAGEAAFEDAVEAERKRRADAKDITDSRAALAEPGPNIPYEQVRRELGLADAGPRAPPVEATKPEPGRRR
jgi:hypothetical protein